ncbi:selenoneine synthase SenA [Rhodoferax sp.]|uniref:selenoneine synthase SenA n=1 Tax=Rhodoferax sp. TaxID=50421 RepID=UPI00273556A3|nr:selenoneine synthase SenA [Rhodoferax sp.]MDP3192476.1 selenoneine synthase SenA [Rhodoferax sp.]MDP3337975.1 selenoneine synthase SenA [Rhodoferax sp.]
MLPESIPTQSSWQPAQAARTADAPALAQHLRASRAHTLALLEAYEAALGPLLTVPCSPQLNPPLWEVGHIGWFQEFWLARNPQRRLGMVADPQAARPPALLPQSDALYNSSVVAHDSRWSLPLPDLQATRAYLQATLEQTLALLADEATDDAALYFYRLALFHEDMHGEAAVYMAQALGIGLPPALSGEGATRPGGSLQSLNLAAGDWTLGYTGRGFAFDNELVPHRVPLGAYAIDNRPVSWRRYLPFVEQGAYADAQWWLEAGWQWLQAGQGAGALAGPRYLRQVSPGQGESVWEQCRFGQWHALDLDAPACHLGYFEAEAWCRWAGRQLPTEAQWEQAAMTQPGFVWGEVWEWTASTFNAYPGFVAHPYRDYSAPWFGDRPVLRGASRATSERMAHPRYRNYFTPERNDLHAGFRSCAG